MEESEALRGHNNRLVLSQVRAGDPEGAITAETMDDVVARSLSVLRGAAVVDGQAEDEKPSCSPPRAVWAERSHSRRRQRSPWTGSCGCGVCSSSSVIARASRRETSGSRAGVVHQEGVDLFFSLHDACSFLGIAAVQNLLCFLLLRALKVPVGRFVDDFFGAARDDLKWSGGRCTDRLAKALGLIIEPDKSEDDLGDEASRSTIDSLHGQSGSQHRDR